MTNREFMSGVKSFFDECIAIMETKGNEYSGSEEKFANFIRLGKKFGVPRELILMVYLQKHLDSIDSYIRAAVSGNRIEYTAHLSEPIEGRIADAINYLLILQGMVKELEDNDY